MYRYIDRYVQIYINIHMYILTSTHFFCILIYTGDMCVCVYVCTYTHLCIYTCAYSLSSNLIDLSSPLTCAQWHVGRQDRLAVGVLWRALGDGARACCARRVARGGRQGTHTHACALRHVLYEGCVCDYEEHEDGDYLCMQMCIFILHKLI